MLVDVSKKTFLYDHSVSFKSYTSVKAITDPKFIYFVFKTSDSSLNIRQACNHAVSVIAVMAVLSIACLLDQVS